MDVSALRTTAGTRQRVRPFGYGLNFTAAGHKMACSKGSLTHATGSISMWIVPSSRPKTFGGDRLIIGTQNNDGFFVLMWSNADNSLAMTYWTAGYSANYATLDNTPDFLDSLLIPQKWTHLVVTWEGSTGNASNTKFYLDGVLRPLNGDVNINNGNIGNIQVGSNTDFGGDAWPGVIDELALFSRALTQTEVDNIYYRGLYPPTGQTHMFHLNEGSGTSATDSVGGNTGTITGATYVSETRMANRAVATGRSLVP